MDNNSSNNLLQSSFESQVCPAIHLPIRVGLVVVLSGLIVLRWCAAYSRRSDGRSHEGNHVWVTLYHGIYLNMAYPLFESFVLRFCLVGVQPSIACLCLKQMFRKCPISCVWSVPSFCSPCPNDGPCVFAWRFSKSSWKPFLLQGGLQSLVYLCVSLSKLLDISFCPPGSMFSMDFFA